MKVKHFNCLRACCLGEILCLSNFPRLLIFLCQLNDTSYISKVPWVKNQVYILIYPIYPFPVDRLYARISRAQYFTCSRNLSSLSIFLSVGQVLLIESPHTRLLLAIGKTPTIASSPRLWSKNLLSIHMDKNLFQRNVICGIHSSSS